MTGAPDDHRAALARIDAGRMAEMRRLSDAPGLVRLGAHLGLIGLTGWAVVASDGWLRLPAQMAHGTALVFLFCLCHEAIHRTAFRTRWLNDRAAQAAGFAILLPAHAFRYLHFAHHRYTQDPARDPELAIAKPRNVAEYLWRLTGWHYWRGQVVHLFGAAFGAALPAWVPPRGRAKVRREARWYLALYATIAALAVAMGPWPVLHLWLLPILLGQPVLRAFLLAEHTGCPMVPDMLENTRTTFASRAVRWLGWEMPYHTAHHTAPMVPFHRLGDMTHAMRGAIRAEAASYPDAHCQIVEKLGDPPLSAG